MTWADVLMILNLFLLESLLSVDNAAVLAGMVQHLPLVKQKKALTWGIWGAIILRGACLLFASRIMELEILKLFGGAYLAYLSISHFTKQRDSIEEARKSFFKGFIGTIISVEIADLAFSVDNVFAAVAMSKKLWIIGIGVFMGMITMRFVAGWMAYLMKKYPSMETSAFIIIGVLSIRLMIEASVSMLYKHYKTEWMNEMLSVMTTHIFDITFGAFTTLLFFIPILRTRLLNIKK